MKPRPCARLRGQCGLGSRGHRGGATMTVVGIPREIKTGERRVALTPDGARALGARGATVLVEHDAGVGSGFRDEQYAAAGESLVDRAILFRASNLIVKVKEPLDNEPDLLHAGQTLFCYL